VQRFPALLRTLAALSLAPPIVCPSGPCVHCSPCPPCFATLLLDPVYHARPEPSPVVRGRNSTRPPGALVCAPRRPRVASSIKCERPSPYVPAASPPPDRSSPRPPLCCTRSPTSPSLAPPYLSHSATTRSRVKAAVASFCITSPCARPLLAMPRLVPPPPMHRPHPLLPHLPALPSCPRLPTARAKEANAGPTCPASLRPSLYSPHVVGQSAAINSAHAPSTIYNVQCTAAYLRRRFRLPRCLPTVNKR
jgi:hypothetical protein